MAYQYVREPLRAEEADRLWSNGVPLVLSGHTHAGQVTLARLHEITLGRNTSAFDDYELLRLGPLALRWYGVCFALAFLLGYGLVRWIFRREQKPERDLDRLGQLVISQQPNFT